MKKEISSVDAIAEQVRAIFEEHKLDAEDIVSVAALAVDKAVEDKGLVTVFGLVPIDTADALIARGMVSSTAKATKRAN